MRNFSENQYAVPASIVAAGLMVAAAIFSNVGASTATAAAPAPVARAAAAGCGV